MKANGSETDRSRCRSRVPPEHGNRGLKLAILLLVTALALYAGVHGAFRGWELQRRLVCAHNLQELAAFVRTHGSPTPDGPQPTLQTLTAQGQAPSRRWVCPSAGLGQSNYVVVSYPPSTQPLENRAVIAYEPNSNHGGEGGNVVFADGHAEFVLVPEYNALIRRLSASLEKEEN